MRADRLVGEAPGDDEMIDVLDAEGVPTGERKARSAVHADGDWHRTVHVWVVRRSGHVLVQRRAQSKQLEPGRIDVSVGGHLLAGELQIDVAREVEEELGLHVRPGDLTYLGTLSTDRRYGPYHDREHQDVYAVVDETPLAGLSLQPGEVEVVYELPLQRAIDLFDAGAYVPAEGFDSQRRVSNALLVAADLPSRGADVLAEELRRVAAWLAGEDPESLAALPFDVSG